MGNDIISFAAHSWMNDLAEDASEPNMKDSAKFPLLEADNYSFSNPSIARNHDYSFGDESPAIDCGEVQNSSVLTCRSSFSSFLIDQSHCSISGGYSFENYTKTDAPEFSSPLPSMPSFTFFSPNTVIDQSNDSSFRGKSSMTDGGICIFFLMS